MESLLILAIALAIAAVYFGFRQFRNVTALRERVAGQDRTILELRNRVRSERQENTEIEALYAVCCDVAFDSVLLLDTELTIVSTNRAAEQVFNSLGGVGKKIHEVIDSPDLVNLLQVALNETDSLEEQFEIDGRYYRARTQVFELEPEHRFIGIAMQDITNLVSLNRARRDLVANISHELRTPITRIRLIIEGLFLDADRPKRKASIQSLKEIAMETDALLWLSQELLDLSMIESGQAIMRLVPTSLKQVGDEAIERLSPQAEMKELSIIGHIPLGINVLCDADQLKRALGNLVHNAIKWSPQNDAITITAAEANDEVTVSVFDNGPGVPEDLRERVFERFYQADVSRSGDEGTGLGLAICKHIIEAHGGKIWAQGNGQGDGGHFIFTLLKADTPIESESHASDNGLAAVEVSSSVTTTT